MRVPPLQLLQAVVGPLNCFTLLLQLLLELCLLLRRIGEFRLLELRQLRIEFGDDAVALSDLVVELLLSRWSSVICTRSHCPCATLMKLPL